MRLLCLLILFVTLPGRLAFAPRFSRHVLWICVGWRPASLHHENSIYRRIEYCRISVRPLEYVVADPDARIVAVITVNGVLRTFFFQSEVGSGLDMEQYFVEQARKDVAGSEVAKSLGGPLSARALSFSVYLRVLFQLKNEGKLKFSRVKAPRNV